MKPKFIALFNEIAHSVAKMSHARRLQVGAIVVKDDRVISMGYNGMPAGWDNNCEDLEWIPDGLEWTPELMLQWPMEGSKPGPNGNQISRCRLKTKSEVLHAESNAISKLARSHESGDGATLFITHAPCMECSKLIFQSGIRSVFYKEDYRDDSGVRFLKQSGVEITKHE